MIKLQRTTIYEFIFNHLLWQGLTFGLLRRPNKNMSQTTYNNPYLPICRFAALIRLFSLQYCKELSEIYFNYNTVYNWETICFFFCLRLQHIRNTKKSGYQISLLLGGQCSNYSVLQSEFVYKTNKPQNINPPTVSEAIAYKPI